MHNKIWICITSTPLVVVVTTRIIKFHISLFTTSSTRQNLVLFCFGALHIWLNICECQKPISIILCKYSFRRMHRVSGGLRIFIYAYVCVQICDFVCKCNKQSWSIWCTCQCMRLYLWFSFVIFCWYVREFVCEMKPDWNDVL